MITSRNLYIATGSNYIIHAQLKQDGSLVEISRTESDTPTWTVLNDRKDTLVCVNEMADKLQVFRVLEGLESRLHLVETVEAQGMTPCHLSLHPNGWLGVANYNSNYALFRLSCEGDMPSLRPVMRGPFVPGPEGCGPRKDRQDQSHPHMWAFDASYRFVFITDLGRDAVLQFLFDSETGALTPNPVAPLLSLHPGSGPRHIAFHSTLDLCFIVNELESSVSVCKFDKSVGTLSVLTAVSCLPAGAENAIKATNTSAGIACSPCGRFLLVSNRGHDSISVFRCSDNGEIVLEGNYSSRGKVPRFFCFTPCGGFILVANQNSDSVVTFRFSDEGIMSPVSELIGIPSPQCVSFV